MTEVALWGYLRPLLDGWGEHPIRVENGLDVGTPDANYAHGWVELKQLPDWPVRPGTPVAFEWRRGQKAWLASRWMAGGLCWVFARVGSTLLLFDGWTAAQLTDEETQQELRELAIWPSRPYRSNHSLTLHLRLLLTGRGEDLEPRLRLRWYRARARRNLDQMAAEMGLRSKDLRRAETGEAGCERAVDLLEAWEC